MPRQLTRAIALTVAVGLVVATAAFFVLLAARVDQQMNQVLRKPPYAPSVAASALHRKLRIVDMHDDLLLWPRDPLERSSTGSTDVPRLLEGNVALEIFSTVSKTPRGQNYAGNSGETDNITLLAAAERRPLDNWLTGRHLLARARWTSEKLHAVAARSHGRVTIVTSSTALERALVARDTRRETLIVMLSLEGLQVLEGRAENLDTLLALGFRMAGLTHFFDNDVAGSAHGLMKGGLSPLGREVVRAMERKGMIVDLAHVAPAAVDEVLSMATRPLVVSHGGVAAVCAGPRNWTDDQLRRLKVNGGVIGIGFWDAAVCQPTPKGIAKAIRHAVSIAGIDHVGLGSDWDGAVAAAVDASGLALITEALLNEDFTEDEIRKIMGENVIRLLLAGLPKN